MKLALVIGTRPQAIKVAPIFQEISKYPEIKPVLINTGQHWDNNLWGNILDELGVPHPHKNLKCGGGDNITQISKILVGLKMILEIEKPDNALIFGDTNSTLASALALYEMNIPFGHVEAGLRENIHRAEEINKKIADHCATWCFCPTSYAYDNLRYEGISSEKLMISGDITYDTFILFSHLAKSSKYSNYYLCEFHTAHTADNKTHLKNILDALRQTQKTIVWPIHPRVKKRVKEFRLSIPSNIELIEPVSYLEMLGLIKNSDIVLTDSSGTLKDAFYSKKYSVFMDYTSEYINLIDERYSILATKKPSAILSAIKEQISKEWIEPRKNYFGIGKAANHILAKISLSNKL
jgi:UDP-GlcNAc3NAcA epimerase